MKLELTEQQEKALELGRQWVEAFNVSDFSDENGTYMARVSKAVWCSNGNVTVTVYQTGHDEFAETEVAVINSYIDGWCGGWLMPAELEKKHRAKMRQAMKSLEKELCKLYDPFSQQQEHTGIHLYTGE